MRSKNSSIVLLIASSLLLSCNFVRSLVPIGGTPSNGSTNEAPAECTKFTLTPEECANAGTHEYSSSTEVLFDQTGHTCQPEDSNITISINFLSRDSFSYTDSFSTEIEFTRKEHNYYEAEFVQPDGRFKWRVTLQFTNDGFTAQGDSYDLENDEQHLCTFVAQQKIILVREE